MHGLVGCRTIAPRKTAPNPNSNPNPNPNPNREQFSYGKSVRTPLWFVGKRDSIPIDE